MTVRTDNTQNLNVFSASRSLFQGLNFFLQIFHERFTYPVIWNDPSFRLQQNLISNQFDLPSLIGFGLPVSSVVEL